MELNHIIAEIADQTDEFLDGVTDRAQARAGIAELINMDYFTLNPAQRKAVTDGVMAELEKEEYFGTEFVGDAFNDDEPGDDD